MKLQFFLASAAALVSVQLSGASYVGDGGASSAPDGAVEIISEDSYRRLVEDFTTPEWEYLGDMPAVVDFYADWCGPCRRLSPVIDKVAEEYEGRVRFYKVDVDSAESLARAYGIRSIPSVLFIPLSGEPVMSVGLISESELKEKVRHLLPE